MTRLILPLLLAVLACNMPAVGGGEVALPIATDAPPASSIEAPTQPPLPTVETGWQNVAFGVDVREATIPAGGREVPASLVRVDPAQVELRVHYTPGEASTVREWHRTLGALLTVNGGFFYPDFTTLGLIIAEGQPFGTAFSGHGGMLSVSAGTFDLRSMAQVPYDPSEAFDFAVQGRPMLLYPGGYPAAFDLNPEAARRTAVALDYDQRLIFLSVGWGEVSLYQLRDWMAESRDPAFFAALNLDGGGSTGLMLTAPAGQMQIDSFSEVPSVIAVYPR